MSYKLIGMDFDGTLLTSDKKVTEKTKNILLKYKNNKYIIVGITARNFKSVKDVCDINMFNYLILNNGSYIYDVENKKGTDISNIDKNTAIEITDKFKNIAEQIDYCTLNEYYINKNKIIKSRDSLKQVNSIKKIEEPIARVNIFLRNNDEIDRVSNIEEFYGLYREYIKQNPLMELEDFLNELALRSDQEDMEMRQEKKGVEGISCMSVHSSKGLEFDYVFIIGLEEGFFPMVREDSNIQEERRLGYVAFTRAKKELYLSYVDSRFYRGNRTNILPSRFLEESGVLKNSYKTFKKENTAITLEDSGFKKGDCVIHKIFDLFKYIRNN